MIAVVTSLDKLESLKCHDKFNSYDIFDGIIDIKKLLVTFKNAIHYTDILIDISVFNDDDNDFLHAIKTLKAINKTNIIIVAKGKNKGDYLLSELVKIGVYNFVLSYILEVSSDELNKSFLNQNTYDDMQEFIINNSTDSLNKKNDLFSKMKINNNKVSKQKNKEINKIHCFGACSRIGTTTQAISIAKSISYTGYTSCYVENNNSGHLDVMKQIYEIDKVIDDKTFIIQSIIMSINDIDAVKDKYDYLIIDYGVFSSDKLNNIDRNDIIILIVGSKAWEIIKLPEIILLLENFTNKIYIFIY